MTEEEKIAKRMDKNTYYVLETESYPMKYNGKIETETSYVVVFEQKGKVKYGIFRIPYTARYGITVVGTFAGESRWWFSSPGVVSEAHMGDMKKLFDAGTLDYPAFRFSDHLQGNSIRW